jgi:putative Ca2+/H+ antiporter (TMEM165/GDT1 family)
MLVDAGLVGDSQFTEGFVSGLLLIFFSEIGDKTFFIALLLALKQVSKFVLNTVIQKTTTQ